MAATDSSATPDDVVLAAEGLVKTFPGVKALQGVNLSLRRGEIHSLMGENGAGKSTLIKVLTGVYRADGGSIRLSGFPITPRSPLDAQRAGISTVYQEVNLVPQLSVAENICLGRQPKTLGFIRWCRVRAKARQALGRLGVNIDVNQTLSTYSIAIQQLVAIARAVDLAARVLILDEPTSSLDRGEVQRLFIIMRELKKSGLTILFVTHFLDQVYAVSDRITVLRNGQLVGTYDAAQLPRLELIRKMLGRDVSSLDPDQRGGQKRSTVARTPLVEVRHLTRRHSIEDLNFSIEAGEVLGLAGLLGSGRTETARLLFGIDQPTRGKLCISGKPLSRLTPKRAVRLRFAFLSEDRKTEGIIPNLSIRENIILALQARRGPFRPLPRAEQDRVAERYIAALRIATPDAERPIKLLSGGNQQKVLLARWLASDPVFLILDEPTRGIDIGAKFEILNLTADLIDQGMALLFISSELEEIVRTCHRVVVLRDRRQVAELHSTEISEPTIMRAIAEEHEK